MHDEDKLDAIEHGADFCPCCGSIKNHPEGAPDVCPEREAFEAEITAMYSAGPSLHDALRMIHDFYLAHGPCYMFGWQYFDWTRWNRITQKAIKAAVPESKRKPGQAGPPVPAQRNNHETKRGDTSI